MSEEEKKVIEKLKGKKNDTTWNDTIRQIKREEITDVVVTRQKYITTILNLIEKLQKELEQEKEKNKDLEYENWIMRAVDRRYIPKDKIRAKIEELQCDEDNYENYAIRRAYKELLEE